MAPSFGHFSLLWPGVGHRPGDRRGGANLLGRRDLGPKDKAQVRGNLGFVVVQKRKCALGQGRLHGGVFAGDAAECKAI